MNIGIFSDTYEPQINGVTTSIKMLYNELTKKGHNVYIFTISDPKAEPSPNVFRLPSIPFVFLPSHRVAYAYPPNLILKLRKLKLDIVHTQTEFPLGIFGKLVSEFYRIPCVHTYHTMYEEYVHYVAKGHILTPKFAQTYSRIFCNRARAVIAPVEKTKESLLQYGVKRPISVIPTGIDLEPFKQGLYSDEEINEAKKEVGLNLTDPVIVTVTRVAKEKSIDVIIRQLPKLLEKIPTVKFVVVGPGPMIDELKELSASLGVQDSVIFAGPKPWNVIGKYYQMGDLFTTASTSETQGLTYIEAMAAKVPVVVKQDKSFEGIIADGRTGYCFDKDDMLPDVLYKALTNKQASAAVAENAYYAIQHLSSKYFADKIEDLYYKLINKTPLSFED